MSSTYFESFYTGRSCVKCGAILSYQEYETAAVFNLRQACLDCLDFEPVAPAPWDRSVRTLIERHWEEWIGLYEQARRGRVAA